MADTRAVDGPAPTQDPIAYHAQERPTRLACVDFRTGERVTYAELDTLVAKTAGWLAVHGAGLGARIAYLGRNSLMQLAVVFASRRLGAIVQPLNWRLSGRELAVLIADAEPALLLCEPEFEAAALEADGLRSVMIDDELRGEIAAATPVGNAVVDAEAPFILLYTSGTTGKPKGAIVTRGNAYYGALNFIGVGHVGVNSTMLCDAPMFHTVGLVAVAYTSMHAGAAVLMSDRFVAATTLRRLADPELAVTHYFAVPQSAQMLVDDPSYTPAALARLTGFFSGGAPMPRALLTRLVEDGVMISNGYGMSEAGTVMHMPLDRAAIRTRPGCVGLPAPHVEVRIVTPEGRDAKTNETGEIWLRGGGISPGYWRQPEASAATFVEGWLRTGDAGAVDEDGFYRLVDRWKDMYITGGENVYPAEVEAVLAQMTGMAEIAIVGVTDERWGETGCAFVVAKTGAEINVATIAAFCEGRLARYKHPRLVRLIEALPRTASGKIQKNALREAFAAERAS